MKKFMVVTFVLLFFLPAAVILLGQLGLFSASPPKDLGVVNNRLKAPSKTENSVCSQAPLFSKESFNVDYADIKPIAYQGTSKKAFLNLKQVLRESFNEARLVSENEIYLRYEFKTKLMKYIDDVEFLIIENENLIHFRSASRLGRRDLGKNRDRMEQIRIKFTQLNKSDI